MDPQFELFERPEKKGINQPITNAKPYRECEMLESAYKEHLHHCRRVKAQTDLPNEILNTFQQQVFYSIFFTFDQLINHIKIYDLLMI